MTSFEIISAAVLILSLFGTLLITYTRLNVKIAEIYTDIIHIKKDYEEHRHENNDDFNTYAMELKIQRQENREDHDKIIEVLEKIRK